MARVEYRRVDKTYPDGSRALADLNLEIADGEMMVLVGPSGCGKSTALRLLAGLDPVSHGEILIDGKLVNDLAPQQRDIAMVFQNYALYPHLTVRRNLEFPLRMRRLSKTTIRKQVEETAGLLGLTELLARRPGQLSGGQRQRVAMGRALVRQPQVFLMDEPLSNLDARLRTQIRAEIATLQKGLGITTLYVTHDQVEAMTLGDRIAVLSDGRLQQLGPPQQVYDRPANTFVAAFLGNPGMNIFPVNVDRERGMLRLGSDAWQVPIDRVLAAHSYLAEHLDRPLLAGLRPEAFSTDLELGVEVLVESVESLGCERLVYFRPNDPTPDGQSKPLVARLYGAQVEEAGQPARLGADVGQLHFFTEQGDAIDL